MKFKHARFMYITIAVILIFSLIFFIVKKKSSRENFAEIKPHYGTIKQLVIATGTINPQNRLEIKPPINGRLEKLFVREGEKVKLGEVLGLMSSTERAALLDAARSKGDAEVDYWENAYKPVPIMAPINGEVIVRAVEPGQTISSTNPILVLSDRLIVQADIDETDIGKIKIGQIADIILDAYPEEKILGKVDHIAYESTVVNNVTIYSVDIVPDRVPEVFRSGMSATVTIIEQSKENVLIIPSGIIKQGEESSYVLLRTANREKPKKQIIEIGISDDKNTEVISGLTIDDSILVKSYVAAQEEKTTGSPFMPSRGRRR